MTALAKEQFNINILLERIGRHFLTFKYLLHQLSPHPSAIITSEEEDEPLRDRKRRKICQQEKEKVITEANDINENKRRRPNKGPILPVEFVKLLSDYYLTWEDLSKKNAVPMIIKNPNLFLSCSLDSGMTDFEYFCFRTPEKKREIDLGNAKIGYEKLKRIILNNK